MGDVQWNVKTFEELTNRELYSIIKSRVDVFVVEQECAYPEVDDKDPSCTHLYLEDAGTVVAYSRLVPADVSYPQASIGRVLVNQSYRGNGYGRKLLEKSIGMIKEKWGEQEVKIQAQTYLKDFYSSFGFEQISDTYLDDGIPHIDMLLRVATS